MSTPGGRCRFSKFVAKSHINWRMVANSPHQGEIVGSAQYPTGVKHISQCHGRRRSLRCASVAKQTTYESLKSLSRPTAGGRARGQSIGRPKALDQSKVALAQRMRRQPRPRVSGVGRRRRYGDVGGTLRQARELKSRSPLRATMIVEPS